jgi:flagellar biosynthesis protein
MSNNDKPLKATAIEYDPTSGQDAPKVVASGLGKIAERIIEIAESEGIQIHRDPDLAELLSKVDVGNEIPAELFTAVAEVLSFLHRSGKRKWDLT